MDDFNKDLETFTLDFERAEKEQLEYLRLYRQMTQKQENCQIRKDFKSLQETNLNEENKKILTEKKANIDHFSSKLIEMQRNFQLERMGFICLQFLVILAFFVLAYILPPFRIVDALCNFLLVWYYCTLTIRESILRLNGSRIKGWWVLHHYISCVLCGITLTWRDGECYDQIRHVFIYFVCYIGSVQIIQYKYQTGCLRRLHALGQRHCMDVTLEGFSSWMFKGLTFLLPFLIIGYAFKAIIVLVNGKFLY
ncbi:hypothetical protein Mgra_00009266 [Meloidogyne graminicola]|uniref:Uncharacterized protein n=1 Tax=Meloidogyne graminicola TaxID=189291 RepID=A0A8S9ZDE3_9BILA|nr:hypothetical protein Mgra_00009266 [Meloidogyne graminicola]